MKSISFGYMISEMDRVDANNNPVPFSCTFVTADRIKKTGGEIITIENAQKCAGKRGDKVLYASPVNTTSEKSVTRDPHHRENETRNLYLKDSRQIRKVHVRLITRFNGKNVIP